MSSALLERLKKNSTIKDANVLSESTVFENRPLTNSGIPILNLAMSGKLDGGYQSGLHLLAGASKMFKSTIGLICAAAYLKKYDDAVLMFYDSEFGSPKEYFSSLGIDPTRVLHTPILDVETLKFDLVKQLNDIKLGDHVVILIDSIGNLASKKEVEDAINQKSVADMSRAKSFKSLFRIVTPHLVLKDISMFAIAHTYMSMDFMPKTIVSGGRGQEYSSHDIWIISRRQEKEGTDIVGYNFIITVDKSRTVREKSKVPLSVSFEDGIEQWSGLFDLAVDLGYIEKPKMGWYNLKTNPDKLFRQKDTDSMEFWSDLLDNDQFKKDVSDKYLLIRES